MTTLLATKTIIPPTRAKLVARPRLVEQLQQGLRMPLTLVCAPAGWGKTTLLSSWAQSLNTWQVAWLSLDDDDDELTRFVGYVVAAFTRIMPTLAHMEIAHHPAKTAMTLLLNALNEHDQPLMLVIDDYHLVKSPAIHEQMRFLIERAPAHLRIVIGTRSTPALPMARFRARHQVSEINVADIRFTQAEARDFLHETMGIELDPATFQRVLDQTEGWVAGLQLAALSLAHKHDLKDMPTNHISEYLLDEVFNQQTADVQHFLLHTAPLERMSASLCAAVMPNHDRLSLAQIEEMNLFLLPLDANKRWYRYHHLFRDFLRERLDDVEPPASAEIQRHAAHWCVQHHLPDEAIHYALNANDYERAASLIADQTLPALRRGAVPQLERWIARLPVELIWRDSRLCLAQLWRLMMQNRAEDASLYATHLYQKLQESHDHTLTAETLALGAVAAVMANDNKRAIELAQQSEQQPQSDDPYVRAIVAFGLAAASIAAQDYERSLHWFKQSAQFAKTSNNMFLASEAMTNVGNSHYQIGDLYAAERACRQALRWLEDEPDYCGGPYWILARIHHDWGDFAAALDYSERSIILCRNQDNPRMEAYNLIIQARIAHDQARYDDSEHLLQRIEHVLKRESIPEMVTLVAIQRIINALDQRLIQQAHALFAMFDVFAPEQYGLCEYVRGKLAFTQRHYAVALQHWQTAHEFMLKRPQIQNVIMLEIYQMKALSKLARHQQARTTLADAIHHAEKGMIIRPFVREAAIVLPLLREHEPTDFVQRLIQECEAAHQHETAVHLTSREQEILRYLAIGLSNRDIADRLVIAESTLKRHISNLYLKLDVHSRTQALARAAELSIF